MLSLALPGIPFPMVGFSLSMSPDTEMYSSEAFLLRLPGPGQAAILQGGYCAATYQCSDLQLFVYYNKQYSRQLKTSNRSKCSPLYL